MAPGADGDLWEWAFYCNAGKNIETVMKALLEIDPVRAKQALRSKAIPE